MGSGVVYILAGHTELDQFRQREIHSGYKRFLLRLEMVAADSDTPSAGDVRLDERWRNALDAADEVIGRCVEEMSPRQLFSMLPLVELEPARRLRLADAAHERFLRDAGLAAECEALRLQISSLRGACVAAENDSAPVLRASHVAVVIPKLRRLFDALEALPYGVWCP